MNCREWKEQDASKLSTFEKLMADYRLDCMDLLKMDAEGAEKEIFEQSSSWIDTVGMIAVELRDWIHSGCRKSVRSLRTWREQIARWISST